MFFLLSVIQEIDYIGWGGECWNICQLAEKKKLSKKMARDIRCQICKECNLDRTGYAKMMGVSKQTINRMEQIDDYDRKDGQRKKYIKGIKKYLSKKNLDCLIIYQIEN